MVIVQELEYTYCMGRFINDADIDMCICMCIGLACWGGKLGGTAAFKAIIDSYPKGDGI